MHPSPILTDDNARQYRYTERGLVRVYPAPWRPQPTNIRQSWTYRILHALIRGASNVRW
jgi:hypothetical protein